MKKIFYFLASAIVALGAMACQNEVDENINPNETKEISFKVSFDESTRIAMGELTGGKLPFEFDGKGLKGGPDSLYVGYSTYNGEGYDTKRAFLVNSEENPYEFVADAKNQAILQELVGEENIYVVNRNNETADPANGANGLLFKSEVFDLVAGENEVSLSLACSAFYFTVPAGNEASLTIKGEYTTQNHTFGEGTHIVGYKSDYPAVTIAYSVNGVTVKEASLTLTNKVYNLGTLNYEFTTINTKEQLIAFAEHVNAGNNYKDKTVKLGQSIDLEGETLAPIGNSKANAFRGNFDGQGNTISNFTVEHAEVAGLFGMLAGGSIKNLNVNKATIYGNSYAGGIVAWVQATSYQGWQGAADAVVDNCNVTYTEITSTVINDDNAAKVGGIAGYVVYGTVSNSTVANTNITAYRDMGGIAGMANFASSNGKGAVISGNTVGENVTITVDNSTNYNNYTTADQYNVASIVGRISTGAIVENNTGEATIVLPKTAVEKLNEQIAAGESNITISESFEMTATDPRINIAEGQNVNITLAEGVEITGTFAESGSDALFNIAKGGELTIGGEGKIALTAVKGNVSNYGQYIFENCGGVLNITGGTYTMEVTGSGSATWFIPTLINNNSTLGETVTNISGGYFYSETCINIMRQFINHKTATATFNITGGEFEGTGTKTYGIWNQNSGGSGLGYINISGDAKMNNVLVENDAPKANAVVWGGTFGYEPGTAASSYNAVTIKEGYVVTKEGEVWTVAEAPTVATIQALINNAEAGSTITLPAGATITGSDILVISKDITINGNGATLSSTAGRAINVSGEGVEVAISNLNIVCAGERGVNVIQNADKVTLTDVNITAANYAVNVAGSANGAVVVINGGEYNGLNTVNVGGTATVTISGATINCKDNTSSENYNAITIGPGVENAKVTATNCTFNISGDSGIAANNGTNCSITLSPNGVVTENVAAIYYGAYAYTFSTLADALEFAKEGDIVTLLRDAEIAQVGTFKIDVNGHTLTAADGYIATKDGEKIKVVALGEAIENWGIVGAHQGWNTDNTDKMFQIPDTKTYVSRNVTLGKDGFKFYSKTSKTVIVEHPAVTTGEEGDYYLVPSSNWKEAGARFAIYFYGNGETWVSMEDKNGDGIYVANKPANGKTYPNMIFCRMNPANTTNNWDNRWNQTGNLTCPTNGNNCFTVPSGSWDGATTAWSVHTPEIKDAWTEEVEEVTQYWIGKESTDDTTKWVTRWSNNTGNDNITVTDTTKKYDIYFHKGDDQDWGFEVQYIVVESGTMLDSLK